jgi:hypothetical protein
MSTPTALLVLHERPTIPHTNEVLTMFPKLLPYDFSVFQKFLSLIVPRSINKKKIVLKKENHHGNNFGMSSPLMIGLSLERLH